MLKFNYAKATKFSFLLHFLLFVVALKLINMKNEKLLNMWRQICSIFFECWGSV